MASSIPWTASTGLEGGLGIDGAGGVGGFRGLPKMARCSFVVSLKNKRIGVRGPDTQRWRLLPCF